MSTIQDHPKHAPRGALKNRHYIIRELSNWDRLIEENSSGEGRRGRGGRNSRYGFVARCGCVCVIRASNAESVPLMRGNNDLACLSLLSSLSLALSLCPPTGGLTLFASSNASNNAPPLSLSARYEPDLFQTEDRQQVSLHTS